MASKRKREQSDEKVSAEESTKPTESTTKTPESRKQSEEETSFADLGLDPRLLQAVAQQKFAKPTLVQRRAIPLALNGQDVLAKADTGTGKTAAYVLPLLSSILKRKAVRPLLALRGSLKHLANFYRTDRFLCFHLCFDPRPYSRTRRSDCKGY